MVSAVTSYPNRSGAPELRELIAQFAGQVEAHVAARIESTVERAAMAARAAARREATEQLNQATRRLRQCVDAEEVLNVLGETAAQFCDRTAIFTVPGDVVQSSGGREFPLGSAAAFASVVETGEPVIAAATPNEIGLSNTEFFAHPADDRVYLFPVIARPLMVAVLYATAGTRNVEIAALELLSGVASAMLGVLSPKAEPKPAAADLVSIQPAAAASETAQPKWPELDASEQEAHLRAQRLARVLVAEMRLYRPDAVRSGRTRRDLYSVLRGEVDGARERFRQTCFSECRSMTDYLHMELVRSLANDDVRLLGPSYPGPLRHEDKG